MRNLTMASMAILAGCGAATVAAQENAATTARSYDLADFERIAVVGPHHVIVSVGPAFSIRAEGPRQTLDDTEVEVENGRLEIHPVEDGRWERDRYLRTQGPVHRETR